MKECKQETWCAAVCKLAVKHEVRRVSWHLGELCPSAAVL